MKIRFRDPFLHITAVGMLILTIITSGIPGIIYAFIFGSAISQLYLNFKERKQDEKL
tara:strand:+ start:151 stop:321 length:171 start_codon:yes stop_codon:yes gene_type:complete